MFCGFYDLVRIGMTYPSATASGRRCTSASTRWAKAGVWERVLEHLIDAPDNDYISLDSSLVRAHPQAATGKGGLKGGGRLWGVPEVD